MQHAARFLLAACALSLAACGGDTSPAVPADWPSEAERTMEEGHAPTPYTAAQLRDACPTGLRIVYRVGKVQGEPTQQVFFFEKSGPQGANLIVSNLTEGGKILGTPRASAHAWEELQHHASTPKEETTITTETITVPAGTYACIRHTIRRETEEETPMVETLWFAFDLPGPPIRWIQETGGQQVMEMELVERTVLDPDAEKKKGK